jgi:glucokinase
VISLLADVGGTNVRFALADPAAHPPLLRESIRRYRVADFLGFNEAARQYLHDIDARPKRGVFAFAGPVVGDEIHITNHPWTIVLSQTRVALGLDEARAINDFSAMSLAVTLLGMADIAPIGNASPLRIGGSARQTFALVGPGTGLGVGALLVRDGHVDTLDSEGGHLSFAPRNDREIEILRRLQGRFGRVSNERLLCGAGLVNLHRVLCEIKGSEVATLEPKDITQRADEGSDASCVQAVEVFCALLGAAAGDLVLAFGAWDGVYLTGGLTPHLLPWLQRGAFRQRFEDKGRFAGRLADVPTLAVLNEDTGLIGASAQAVLDAGHSLLDRADSRSANGND